MQRIDIDRYHTWNGDYTLGAPEGSVCVIQNGVAYRVEDLPAEARAALIRRLLRAHPDEAVVAVDTSKIGRGWEKRAHPERGGVEWTRSSLSNAPISEVYTVSWFDGEWSDGVARHPKIESAQKSEDDDLRREQWVLAGVARG